MKANVTCQTVLVPNVPWPAGLPAKDYPMNPSMHSILKYVTRHPLCKTVDIVKATDFSRTTVCVSLGRLIEMQKMQYTGRSKAIRYEAVP